jgi:cytochrome c biogenesis protein CcmG/thiol:disulfide interchange protein DsbE
MNRWIAIIPAVVVALAVLMFGLKSLHRDSHVEPDNLGGKPVANLSLQPLEGGPAIDLQGVIKGPALINIFGSWCPPCAVEAPYMMDLKSKGVRMIGIAWKDNPADTAAFLTRLGDPFALVLQDPDGVAAVSFGIGAAPETFLVDSSGKIVTKWLPITSPADEAQVLDRYRATH